MDNICYLNSILQSLFASKVFREYLLGFTNRGSVHSCLRRIFQTYTSCRGPVCELRDLKIRLLNLLNQLSDATVFHVGAQQDAHEVLTSLLHCLEHEASPNDIWPFKLKLIRTFRCMVCLRQWQKTDTSNCYNIEVPKNGSHIEDVLTASFAAKTIDVKCHETSACSGTKAVVTSELFPNALLFLNLKRYRHTAGGRQYLKVSITTALSLTLHNRYSWRAAIVHSGSFDFGHYHAVVTDDVSWFYLSDTDIRQSSVSESNLAYILFYEKFSDDSVHDQLSTTATNPSYPPLFSSSKKASSIAAKEFPTSITSSKPSTETPTTEFQVKGLTNTNNIRYLNSILQCLFASNLFRSYISKFTSSGETHLCLRQIFEAYVHCQERICQVGQLKINLLGLLNKKSNNVFHLGDHQDAHEVLTLFLHCLEQEVSSDDLWPFSLKVVRSFRCTICHRQWHQTETSNCYDVEVPKRASHIKKVWMRLLVQKPLKWIVTGEHVPERRLLSQSIYIRIRCCF